MRTLNILIVTIIFTYTGVQAQNMSSSDFTPESNKPTSETEVIKGQKLQRGSLKGPEAKNYPAWKYQATKVMVAHPQTLEKKTGPEAKNSKVWEDNNQESLVPVYKSVRKKGLKGPRAKNYKPWKKN